MKNVALQIWRNVEREMAWKAAFLDHELEQEFNNEKTPFSDGDGDEAHPRMHQKESGTWVFVKDY